MRRAQAEVASCSALSSTTRLTIPSAPGRARRAELAGLLRVDHVAQQIQLARLSPTFSTRDPEFVQVIDFSWARRPRSAPHGGRSCWPGTSAAVILGGGWAGKVSFNCCSRIA